MRRHDMVVLLNSDMRVERDFLAPLLGGFADEKVFAVSCQIFFSDPDKLREETGLDGGRGGSKADCACGIGRAGDARNRIHVFTAAEGRARSTGGNFWSWGDSIGCWRRSIWRTQTWATWRGSAGGRCYISRRAWCITNIAGPSGSGSVIPIFKGCSRRILCCSRGRTFIEWRMLLPHFFYVWGGAMLSWVFGDSTERPNFGGIARAFWQLPRAVVSRFRARALAAVSDTGGVPKAAGRAFSRHVRSGGTGPVAGLVCFSLPDLSAGTWRGSLHVPDGSGAGSADGAASDRAAGLSA